MKTNSSEGQEEIPEIQIIDELKRFGYKAAIFKAAVELKIWDKISSGDNTSERLATREHWNLVGTRMMLDALCSLGLLDKNDDVYSLVPEAEHYLMPSKNTYRGNSILAELKWEGDGLLADAIRYGKRPIHQNYTHERMADHWVEDYANIWKSPEKSIRQFNLLWKSLDIQSYDNLRILDVACGTGQKSLSLALLNPNVKVTLLDRPKMLQVAKEIALTLGVEKRVTFIEGDLWSKDFGVNQYDVIWLGNITHFFSRQDNIRLFNKSHDALSSRGVIVIDTVMRRDGEPSLLWGAMWLYATSPGGDSYSFKDYTEMLDGLGFENIQNINSQLIQVTRS